MKTLKELEQETTVTVSRVTGSKEQKIQLEKLGVMPGADLTMLDVTSEGVLVDNGRREVVIPDDLLDSIKFGAQFKRAGDPMFIGGLCAGGNNQAFFEHFEKVWADLDKQTDAAGGEQRP